MKWLALAIRRTFGRFGGLRQLRGDHAQDAMEYLLVAGAVAVVMVVGLMALDTVVAQVLGAACPSVDTAKGIAATAGSCVQ